MTVFVSNGGVQIAFEHSGAGEPVLLLHGFSQNRTAWREAGYVEALTRSGRSVVLVDLRGHGESDKPHDPAAYQLQIRASDVIAVLDALSIERADLLGYSMGGAIAMATAIHFPERWGSVTIGGAQPYFQDMSFYRDAVADALESWVATIERHVGPLPSEARAMFLRNDIDALRAAVAHDRPDLSHELAASPVPVLLYAGSEDPVHELARLYAERTRTRLLTLSGLNHIQAFFAVDRILEAALQHCRTSTSESRRRGPYLTPPDGRPLSAVVRADSI